MSPKFANLLAAIATLSLPAVAAQLPALNIDQNKTTLSGISSGGYMAQQLHTAYADKFMAVAILAGGPFYCAENNIGLALRRCMKPTALDMPDKNRLVWLTEEFAKQDKIAPTSAMTQDRVWIFSSPRDTVVHQSVADVLAGYYQHFVPTQNVQYVNSIGGEHSMPTDDFGFDCNYLGASSNPDDHFINNCGYDAAGELLKFSYNRLKRPVEKNALQGEFLTFDQSEFTANPNAHGLASQGFAYVPAQCAKGARCKLHIALHGCLQSADRIGDTFYRNAGYNEWADANKIVVLYPQATASLHEGNGNGCWDWWGYDDADYAFTHGRQMQAVMAMANKLMQADDKRTAPKPPTNVMIGGQIATQITLTWTPSADAQQYQVYHSQNAGGPYLQVNTQVIIDQQISMDELAKGRHYFVITSVDASGLEGGPSNEVAVTVPGL
ncbi:extracellular catalytic domain type 2 short-chain-length polyhydroxyalkanoate depolymerase [Simiduia aestuariiviva]|uniref:Fibronectin type-III domain-containing protein n=1 Tax=Simiduia aestuariiviva TaxID=1510459 RepID=A0A839UQP7_9GAMM|nr:PHB depolymerase family esterase [Simiduia aestuariiviva]MBB3167695.1 hypothetical protein [Simiduia aestuariiviva]